jgi:hypothetical protein
MDRLGITPTGRDSDADIGIGRACRCLLNDRGEIAGIQSEKSKSGQEMDLELRLPRAALTQRILSELGKLPGVEVQSVSQAEEA